MSSISQSEHDQFPGNPRCHDFMMITLPNGEIEKYEIKIVTPTHLVITSIFNEHIVKIASYNDKWIITNLTESNLTESNQPESNQPESNQPESNQPESNQPESNQAESNQADPIEYLEISVQPREITVNLIGASFFLDGLLKELREKVNVNNYTDADKILTIYQRNLLAEAILDPEGVFANFYIYPMEDKTKEERFDFLNWLQHHNAIIGIDLLYHSYITEDGEIIYDVIEWMTKYQIPLNTSKSSNIDDLVTDLLHMLFSEDNVELFRALGGICNFYETAFDVTRDDVLDKLHKLADAYPSAEKIKQELTPTTKAVSKS
jgi:hypothetical protein